MKTMNSASLNRLIEAARRVIDTEDVGGECYEPFLRDLEKALADFDRDVHVEIVTSAEDIRKLTMTFLLGMCVGELANLAVPLEEIREAFERAVAALPAKGEPNGPS